MVVPCYTNCDKYIHMKEKVTSTGILSAFELAKQSAVSAKKFLDSDTPAANATKTILAIAALAPIAVVGAMAPNVFLAFKPFMKKHSMTVRETSYALRNLDRGKYLSIKRNQEGQTEICITKKGMKQARKLCLETIALPKPTSWDGKWHLLLPCRYRLVSANDFRA